MSSDNRDNRSNSDISGGIVNQTLTPDQNKESRFKQQSAVNQNLKKKLMNSGKMHLSKDQSFSSQLITSQNNPMRSQLSRQQKNNNNNSNNNNNNNNGDDESKNLATTDHNQNDVEMKRKGIFEEYQERWNKNNKKIFRYLITWRVGDDGKIEDQLKLMITYLSLIFIFILVLCGFATTYYFHQTNKENIRYSIENQAQTILENGLSQYQNSTEYIFKGYEFVLNYLNDIILSKLEISYKIYNFNEIRQFPYKGPNRMHQRNDPDVSKCDVYKGKVQFDNNPVSMKCIDWFEFDKTTKPTDHKDVYQQDIPYDKLNNSIDILNYILESQLFDVFVTKIYKIYFGFEVRQQMFGFPGLMLSNTPDTYRVHQRSWYNNTKWYHLNQKDNSTFRVISSPYYDAGTDTRVVTISKAILAPSPEDPTKRYLKGKGLFMGVASVDIKLKEFQELFQDITFYETGYLAIVSNQGKLLNEPAEFIKQIEQEGKTFEELSITQLIEESLWDQIKISQKQQLQTAQTKQGLEIVIASTINTDNFYVGESIVIMFIIPHSEVYGAIDEQNSENLKRILYSSLISFGGFLLATIICTIYVKKKIIQMVSAITELNQSALKLSGQNNDSSTNSKKEVMQKLNEIQEKAESETIKELVKGFENQLKGISKLGKGGQNILKNGKNVLKYDSAEYCGTNLLSYIDPLLNYLDSKKEKMDTDSINYKTANPLSVNQIPVKTLSSHKSQQLKSPTKGKQSINPKEQQEQQQQLLQPLILLSDNSNDLNLKLINYQSSSHQDVPTSNNVLSQNDVQIQQKQESKNKDQIKSTAVVNSSSFVGGAAGSNSASAAVASVVSKNNPYHNSIKLCQNAKIEGESNQNVENNNFSEVSDNEEDDNNYQF